MSLHGSPTLAFDLRTRRGERLCAALIIVLGSLAPALAGSIASPAVRIASTVVLAVVLTAGFWRAGWLGGSGALSRMVWREDGRWVLTFLDGRQAEATLAGGARMSPTAIWLQWTVANEGPRKRSLLLVDGDLPDIDFRRLLVRLRLDQSECAPTAPQTDPTLT